MKACRSEGRRFSRNSPYDFPAFADHLMSDLYWGFVILAVGTVAMFFVACLLTRRRVGRRLEWMGVIAVAGIVAYVVFLWDNILMARLLPFSNLIVLANWFPPLMGFLGGLVWNGVTGSWIKKGVYLAVMAGVAVFAVVKPIWGEPPQCLGRWANGVCIQTSPKTCSPACAATVLADAGLETTEGEMAELCLTNNGTLWQGLYRGLKLKTARSPWDVEVFTGDLEQLRDLVLQGPVILTVGLPAGPVAEIYTERYGWSRGELHSVVLFGFGENEGSEGEQRSNMGDPGVEDGREQWSVADLRVLYRGRGLRLVPR